MTEAQFRHALQVGHGRAVLYARSHDVSHFRDVILDACLRNLAIDPTCEGTRSEFVFEVIESLPDRDFYRDAIVNALSGDLENWDSVHRFWLASKFAESDDESVKRRMYEAYQPGPRFGEAIGNTFAALDGMEGFLFVADKIGGLLLEDAENVDTGWLMSAAQSRFGENLVKEALHTGAAGNRQLGAFLAANERRADSEWDALPSLSYEELRPKIAMKKWWIRLGTWADRASDGAFEKAARGLLAASGPEDQIGHLRIFRERPFPLDPSLLFRLAEGEEPRIVYGALQALSRLSLPAVRQLAVRLIETRSPYRGQEIDLLQGSFRPGDHVLVLSWFEAETDPEVLHSFQSPLRHFWNEHPEPSTEVTMLLSLYEKGPCSFLREFEVRRLVELGALPDELRDECAWDANEDIRDLVKTPQ